MFRISPEIFTVKDVAKALRITPSAIHKSIKRTRSVRGVRVQPSHGMVLFSRKQFDRITAL